MSTHDRGIAKFTKLEGREESLVDALHQAFLLSISQTKGNVHTFELILESTCKANKNGDAKACEIADSPNEESPRTYCTCGFQRENDESTIVALHSKTAVIVPN
jgi:hypothetical protein